MAKYGSADDLAEILDLSQRRIYYIAKEGKIFTSEPDGKFNIPNCVDSYFKYKYFTDDKLNYDKEHTLLEKAKREKAELQLAKMKNELHSGEIVENILSGMIITCRNRLLSISQKIAPQLIGQKNISKISDIIGIEIRAALLELSEYDPAMFIDEEGDVVDVNEETEISIQESD
jgi:hypothetical protein